MTGNEFLLLCAGVLIGVLIKKCFSAAYVAALRAEITELEQSRKTFREIACNAVDKVEEMKKKMEDVK